ncbi:MAG: InlB B-repeat-containing protein [Coriobacteriales bacterium]|nr:InlB B-repeat-containing protein [Coriobacteriales bacterium]
MQKIQFEDTHGEIVSIFAVSGIPVPWYTVSYDANGGTDKPSDQVKYQGSPIKLSTDKPTRKGYTFKGWAESADAKEAAYQPGDMYTKDADATLYAVWEEEKAEEKAEAVVPTYDAHVQTYGDLAAVTSGPCGVVGESKRLEAFSVKLSQGSIEYRAHVQNHGWMDWQKDGKKAGTTGESRRMEAMQMRLDTETAKNFSVWYRVHSQHLDWMGWAKDGEPAGTVNQSKRVEAYEVQILPKGQTPADYDANKSAFRTAATGKGHVQGTGWMSELPAALLGTTGQSKRLEAFTLTLPAAVTNIYAGGIAYEAHVQGKGWMGEVADGALAGTTGKYKRIEAVKIHLTGELATHMSVWYRVHSQTFGWSGWAKDGDPAGTTGLSKRAEAIEIAITPQNVAAPGPTTDAFRAG